MAPTGSSSFNLSIRDTAKTIIAPAIAGIIAEKTGSYTTPLIWASGFMVIGLVLLFVLHTMQRDA